ncbi:unnamed protein product [Blumeria hordei]|uniref:AB hydrolase-1 domain-containing protein n=1 Tax=Blumeria hordei TaxID=2867405 RepID=A0A383V133_BLUHO|nr:unnamed protein product [Blumeria hordei]
MIRTYSHWPRDLYNSCPPKRLASPLHACINSAVRAQFPRWYRTMKNADTVRLDFDLYEPNKPSIIKSPIIIMHGLFGSKKNNRTISKVYSKELGRPIYSIDLRNHGKSPHRRKFDYLTMAADVVKFIKDHNLEQPTLIGHSMGAKVAMTLALLKPESFRDIISVDNAPIQSSLPHDFKRYIEGMQQVELMKATKNSEAEKILQHYVESYPVRQFLLANAYRTKSNSMKFQIPLETLAYSLPNLGDFPFKQPTKSRFNRPALIVRGTKSDYVPDECFPVIERLFPRYSSTDIEAGHWLISENPEAFLKATIDFLMPREQSL